MDAAQENAAGAAAPASGVPPAAAAAPFPGSRPPPLPLPRPPLPRPPGASTSSLHSYVSEPPSKLAMMKTWAQETLRQQSEEEAAQQQQQQQHAAPAAHHESTSTEPSFVHRSSTTDSIPVGSSLGPHGSSSVGIELPQLSHGARALAFERPTHFQLDPQLAPSRRRTTQGLPAGDAAVGSVVGSGGAATPMNSRLRTSIGWVTSSLSPGSDAAGTVLPHWVAGDLILPAGHADAGASHAAGGNRGGAAQGAAGSPAKEGMRRRPILRNSQQAGPPSPSPKGLHQLADAGEKQTSPSKKPDAGGDEQDDLESLDYDGDSKPFYKRKGFWMVAGPLLVSLIFVLAGTLYITLGKQKKLEQFEMWRLCYFIAGLPIIWWIGRGSMDLAVYLVEKTMFTWQNVLYFCYAVRRPMANLIRAALTTGWWAIMMTAFSSSMDSTLLKWYNNVLKVLGCLTLFMTANLLKVLFAKMLARKFNQHSHYAKMHQALKREYLLHTLLQPRQHYAELDEMEGEEEGEGEEGSDGDGDMHRSQSAPSQLRKKPSSLQRMFRKSGLFHSRRGSAPNLRATKSLNRSLKDRVMFWRADDAKDLHPIEEGEEAGDEEAAGQDGAAAGSKAGGGAGLGLGLGAASSRAALPPDAVALDISADGTASKEDTLTPESPLLSRSPSSSAQVPAPAPPAPAHASRAHAAHAATPHGSPTPVSKLVRHRSDALEAIGVLPPPAPQLSPRTSLGRQQQPASGSQTPVRRRSGEGGGAAERQLSGLVGLDNERRHHLPPVRVAGAAVGSAAGAGMVSREPSLRVPRASGVPGEMRRSASLQSHRSVRSVQQQGGVSGTAAKQRALMHSSSSNSSSTRGREGSQKAVMALKMSKMEKYIRKHALEVTFKDALSRTERSEKVTSELEAKKLGFYLYHNVKADFDRGHIVLEDLEQYLDEKDAKAAMDMLDADGDGQVNVQECCAAIAKVFVERKNLAASLKDARTIVGKLETVIGVVLHIFMGFLYLIIFNVDVMKTWAGFASLFLGFSFVFGNSIRTTYENVVFLFVVHPYDIGESLWLDNDQVKVEEIHLSFTVLLNSCNARIWYPNEKIRIVPFINLTNSGNKGESFKVLVDIGTSGAVLDQLRAAAESVVKSNPKEFNGTIAVNLKEGGGPLKLTISVYYEFSHSGADVGRCSRNRTKMLTVLSDAMRKAGVRYTWPATADGRQPASGAVATSDDAAEAPNAALLL